MMKSLGARGRLAARAAPFYRPEVLATEILDTLERIEELSNVRPKCDRYRCRTGLVAAPEFRRDKGIGRVEDAITDWVSDFFSNAESQVPDLVADVRPDIVFSYERDARAEDILVILEAKPVWQRWITTGEREYSGVTTDVCGRSTGSYVGKNLRQIASDREKLLTRYTDPRDRLMMLALVFQRPGEIDADVTASMGGGWSRTSRHVVDRCNPPGDCIGLTGMVFWR